ncbi:MAG: hypothetical protein ACTSU0_06930, partial [Alphaproteobacteria bacterium]
MRRRELIKAGGALAAGAFIGTAFGSPFSAALAAPAAVPISARPPDLGPDQIVYLWRGTAEADEHAAAYQQRY